MRQICSEIDIAYDINSNRTLARDHRYRSTSHRYAYDALDRLVDDQKGLLKDDASGIESWWRFGAQDWKLDALGNQLERGRRWTWGDTPTYATATHNAANEITSFSELGHRPVLRVYRSDYNAASDADAYEKIAAPGSGDAFNTHTTHGGHLTITNVSADTLGSYTEPEARTLLLLGEETAGQSTVTWLTFPTGATTGQAGLVFGYRSEADYHVRVIDLGAQQVRDYHVVNGVKTLLASSGYGVAAGQKKVVRLDFIAPRGRVAALHRLPRRLPLGPGGAVQQRRQREVRRGGGVGSARANGCGRVGGSALRRVGRGEQRHVQRDQARCGRAPRRVPPGQGRAGGEVPGDVQRDA